MKKWRFLALVVLSVFVLGGTAGADLFFTTADSDYSANSAGIVKGSTYEVFHSLNSNLPAGFANDSVALTFRDAANAERILISERRSTGDTVYIYDLRNWDSPINPTGWNAKNIYDAVSIDNFLYVVTNGWTESGGDHSGEIISVNMNNYTVANRYTFPDEGELQRHPIRIFAYGSSLYVLSNTAAPGYVSWGNSEVFKFNPTNGNLGTPVGSTVKVGINAGGMGSSAALYGSDLYVACLGDFGTTENGSIWKVNLDTMLQPTQPLIELANDIKFVDYFSPMAYGISIADDGTTLLLTADFYDPKEVYLTNVTQLDASNIGTPISFTPTSGYSFSAVYDQHNSLFWLAGGVHLEARDKTGGLLRSFTPAQLADDQIYSLAVIGNNSWSAGGSGGGSGGGGGCDTGAGLLALVMLAVVRSGLLKTRKK